MTGPSPTIAQILSSYCAGMLLEWVRRRGLLDTDQGQLHTRQHLPRSPRAISISPPPLSPTTPTGDEGGADGGILGSFPPDVQLSVLRPVVDHIKLPQPSKLTTLARVAGRSGNTQHRNIPFLSPASPPPPNRSALPRADPRTCAG